MRSVRRGGLPKSISVLALACGLTLLAYAQKKKDVTQTLQLPKDLPNAVEVDLRRLVFHVSPLSDKGLLSRQVHDALSALVHEARGPIYKIRAFVAGSGDTRRVRDIVSEFFSNRHEPLPVLSLARSGGLTLEGAQVVLEGISGARKDVNPYGLAFLSAQTATSQDPLDPVAPLVARSLGSLRTSLKAVGSESADVLRLTCFLSSLTNIEPVRSQVLHDFPSVANAADFVQTERAPGHAFASCEAVARLRSNTGSKLQLLNPEGLPKTPGESQVAVVGAPRIVLTGSQVSFGLSEKDARLAFDRLANSLQQAGTSPANVAFAQYYALGSGIADHIRAIRSDFFDPAHPPAGALLLFEGLPSLDAGFAVDVIAVK